MYEENKITKNNNQDDKGYGNLKETFSIHVKCTNFGVKKKKSKFKVLVLSIIAYFSLRKLIT